MSPRRVSLSLSLCCEGGRRKCHIQVSLPHMRTHPRNCKDGFALAFSPSPYLNSGTKLGCNP